MTANQYINSMSFMGKFISVVLLIVLVELIMKKLTTPPLTRAGEPVPPPRAPLTTVLGNLTTLLPPSVTASA